MMIPRILRKRLKQVSAQYPVLTLTGPRQSGKTTLVRDLFSTFTYLNLEDRDVLSFAKEDPKSFLRQTKKGMIIDEIQRAPHLSSYIQVLIDESKKKSVQFVLTGSQQFEVIEAVNQSLAGRTAIAKLLPFSMAELLYEKIIKPESDSIPSLIYTGFYPRIYHQKLNPTQAYSFYISTYVERDLKNIRFVQDLSQFQRFLKLCATRIGQLTNFSEFGNEIGVDHKTAQSWFSILEASYICFRLPPHFRNFRKRITKSSKLYFYDVGLASYLLGIESEKQLLSHPLQGTLFENLVIADILKIRFHNLKENNAYFFRDHTGNEIDLILDYGEKLWPIEIKSGQTIQDSFLKGLHYYLNLHPPLFKKPVLVYGGEQRQSRSTVEICPLWDLNRLKI